MNDENDWNECLDTCSSLNITPDEAKSKSLLDTARGRIEFMEENIIKENNANYIFESYYLSILEFLHALMLKQGYKVNNHICLGYYLRDVLNKQELYRLFDDCRSKRHALVYYGRKMDFETAKQAIEKSKKLIAGLSILLKLK